MIISLATNIATIARGKIIKHRSTPSCEETLCAANYRLVGTGERAPGLTTTFPKVINTKAVPAGPRYTPCASHSLQARAAICHASSSVQSHSADVRRAIWYCWPYSRTRHESRCSDSGMEGLAHPHNQLPSVLSRLPTICAEHFATTLSKVKIKSPWDMSKLQRFDFPSPHPTWWPMVLARNSSMLLLRSALNSGVSPPLPLLPRVFWSMAFHSLLNLIRGFGGQHRYLEKGLSSHVSFICSPLSWYNCGSPACSLFRVLDG